MTDRPDSAPDVCHLIREAIDAVATPEVRDAVIEHALKRAHMTAIPVEGRPVRVFIREHLHDALVDALGEDVTDGIVHSLSPLMILPTGAEITGYHTRPPVEVPLTPGTPSQGTLRRPQDAGLVLKLEEKAPLPVKIVLVLTRDAERAERVQHIIGDRCPSRQVTTLVEMLDAVREDEDAGAVVVVDCAEANIPAAVLAVARDRPPGARFLFWGPPAAIELKLARLDGRAFRSCAWDATPEHVGALCLALAASRG